MAFRKTDVDSLLVATGRKCAICRSPHHVQVHHIVPKERGGTDRIENGIPLCPNCHDQVHSPSASGRTTRSYTADELRLHRQNAVASAFDRLPKTETIARSPDNTSGTEMRQSAHHAPLPSADTVVVTDQAKMDCERLGVHVNDAVNCILREVTHHPLLFKSSFNTTPFLFGHNVLLLSWTSVFATIERVLQGLGRFPLTDKWVSCLSQYRKAAALPYRTDSFALLIKSTEAKRTISVYKKLTAELRSFFKKLSKPERQAIPIRTISDLLTEAEAAAAGGDEGTMIARLEALLSTVHKLLLGHVPEGATVISYTNASSSSKRLEPPGKPTVLFAEDSPGDRIPIAECLRQHGYYCVEATSCSGALRALVELDFDVIIADLVMPDNNPLGGAELVLAAKKMQSKAKIILATAWGYDAPAQVVPRDRVLTKPYSAKELLTAIAEVLRSGGNKVMDGDEE